MSASCAELERAIVFEETDELDFAGLRTTAGSDKLCQADPKDWLNPQFSLPSEGFSSTQHGSVHPNGVEANGEQRLRRGPARRFARLHSFRLVLAASLPAIWGLGPIFSRFGLIWAKVPIDSTEGSELVSA